MEDKPNRNEKGQQDTRKIDNKTRHKVLEKNMVFGTWIDLTNPSATLGRLVVHWSHWTGNPALDQLVSMGFDRERSKNALEAGHQLAQLVFCQLEKNMRI